MDPHIDLRQLRYFVAVAEERHVSRAAQRLHMSQPPLTRQIIQLEQALGTALFTRSSRTMELTAAGQVLLDESRAVLDRVRAAIDTVQQVGRGEMGKVKIGIIGSAMWGPIPQALKTFHTRYPQVEWTLHELYPRAQTQALRTRQIDIGFWRVLQDESEDLCNECCFEERVAVALPESHELAKRARLELRDLAAQPMVSLNFEMSKFPGYLRQCCLDAGFMPDIVHQALEPQTLLAMVGAGVGLALIPETSGLVRWPGVTVRALKGPCPSANLHVSYRRTENSASVLEFLKVLRAMGESQAAARSSVVKLDATM